ncbi:hypothetical protein DAPPUDRAFT_332406 [Daphnia pulex]|uniref:Uncharacterized protein n=1 Tax=Daphnia pulex TaxID=6669 RepID=E9HPW0_DAPPU|nr:hypothetical protein DAPPUDRAFT_332406 [Daphnia pulex]|eukprot:EFX66226.1 hypothetical protein DAPPUDRAFT_332406 [Daphnia pulex]
MSFSSEILFISDELASFGRRPGPDDLQALGAQIVGVFATLQGNLKGKGAMPHLNNHVQFVMSPIGSVGSGLSSYRDMYCALKDEKGTIYSQISSIMYMLTAVIRNGYDKVTLVA